MFLCDALKSWRYFNINIKEIKRQQKQKTFLKEM